MLALLNVLLWTMIAFETRGYGEDRAEVRHGDAAPGTLEPGLRSSRYPA